VCGGVWVLSVGRERALLLPQAMRAETCDPTDEALLAGVLARDTAAFDVLYERHGQVAYRLAYRLLGDPAGAEDVVQDAFLALWRHAESYGPTRGSARSWLLAIVYHRAVDQRRRRVYRQDRQVTLDDCALPRDAADTWEQASQSLEGQQVRAVIGDLPLDQQRIVILAYFSGLTHDEIARVVHIPLGTVKGRLRLGLHKMRGHLQAPGEVAGEQRPTRGLETSRG